MIDTAKLALNSSLYMDDDNSENDEENEMSGLMEGNAKIQRDYNFELDLDNDDNFGPTKMDDEELCRFKKQLLYEVQGLGSIKNVNGYDMYVKSAFCEESLRKLVNILKTDSPSFPYARVSLGEWRILQNDLLPLLIFHK